jgi:hypothetical protein
MGLFTSDAPRTLGELTSHQVWKMEQWYPEGKFWLALREQPDAEEAAIQASMGANAPPPLPSVLLISKGATTDIKPEYLKLAGAASPAELAFGTYKSDKAKGTWVFTLTGNAKNHAKDAKSLANLRVFLWGYAPKETKAITFGEIKIEQEKPKPYTRELTHWDVEKLFKTVVREEFTEKGKPAPELRYCNLKAAGEICPYIEGDLAKIMELNPLLLEKFYYAGWEKAKEAALKFINETLIPINKQLASRPPIKIEGPPMPKAKALEKFRADVAKIKQDTAEAKKKVEGALPKFNEEVKKATVEAVNEVWVDYCERHIEYRNYKIKGAIKVVSGVAGTAFGMAATIAGGWSGLGAIMGFFAIFKSLSTLIRDCYILGIEAETLEAKLRKNLDTIVEAYLEKIEPYPVPAAMRRKDWEAALGVKAKTLSSALCNKAGDAMDKLGKAWEKCDFDAFNPDVQKSPNLRKHLGIQGTTPDKIFAGQPFKDARDALIELKKCAEACEKDFKASTFISADDTKRANKLAATAQEWLGIFNNQKQLYAAVTKEGPRKVYKVNGGAELGQECFSRLTGVRDLPWVSTSIKTITDTDFPAYKGKVAGCYDNAVEAAVLIPKLVEEMVPLGKELQTLEDNLKAEVQRLSKKEDKDKKEIESLDKAIKAVNELNKVVTERYSKFVKQFDLIHNKMKYEKQGRARIKEWDEWIKALNGDMSVWSKRLQKYAVPMLDFVFVTGGIAGGAPGVAWAINNEAIKQAVITTSVAVGVELTNNANGDLIGQLKDDAEDKAYQKKLDEIAFGLDQASSAPAIGMGIKDLYYGVTVFAGSWKK